MKITKYHKRYWSKLKFTTITLLVIWFFVTFVASFFAKELTFNFFGWPFSFWLGAQGSLFVYLIIVWYYAFSINKLDDEFEKNMKNE
ncbi:MAG: hypothetical protein CBD16_07820 [Betaproteobacteria bacterium TMED156]|mgnify:CR=1 FL=1|nr:MAG: hypothetical protein CBD16_07820 [Betaproteobacteria bacterium TMED156]|tara:strand:- start:540 stop:800 length:261 start_codon:yes stop_codon:yes gene_type:complete